MSSEKKHLVFFIISAQIIIFAQTNNQQPMQHTY